MIFKVTDYVIDYDRINELTAHDNDKPSEGYAGLFVKVARGTIRKHIKTYDDMVMKKSISESEIVIKSPAIKHIINSLIYNRILINIDVEKRENVLEQLLDD